jgi:hypothetical protein
MEQDGRDGPAAGPVAACRVGPDREETVRPEFLEGLDDGPAVGGGRDPRAVTHV